MALIKKFATEFGIDAEYINIFAFEINYQQQGGGVIVGMYIDEKARRDGKKPLQTASLQFGKDDLDYTKELTRADLYEFIKRQEAFSGAEDA